MQTSEAILTRCSVRSYTEQIPTQDQITAIIEAGRWAPSGLNNQPWRFKILRGEQKDGIAAYTHYGKIIKNAPVAIAVLLSAKDSYNRDKDLMAIGASIENMLLCLHDMGLGACWLGEILKRADEVMAFLELGKEFELCALITLGFPAEPTKRKQRMDISSLYL